MLRSREFGGVVSLIVADEDGDEMAVSSYPFIGVFVIDPVPDSPPQ